MKCGYKEAHQAEWSGHKKDYGFYEGSVLHSIISEEVVSLKPSLVLDIGCGSGHLASLVKSHDHDIEIHGVDLCQNALKQAVSLDKSYCMDLNNESISLPQGTYDLILCMEVLEHLYDTGNILQQIRMLLKPGGSAIISVPNYSFWKCRLLTLAGHIPEMISYDLHIHVFNARKLKIKVSEAGLIPMEFIGCRKRLRFLSRISNGLFSEWLILRAVKK